MSWNPFPVSAEALHGRTVVQGETRTLNVSILPFIDREGRVKRVLTVAPDSGEIGVLPGEVVLPRISNLGSIHIPEHIPLFYPIRKAELDELCSLWHFDPWWLLDADCYRDHWARSPLKATNCVSRTTHHLMSVLYRSNLSAAIAILYKTRPAGFCMARWKPHFLPQQPPPRIADRPVPSSGDWILDPLWTRTD